MTLSVWDARAANKSTGRYLSRSFNVDPPEARMMPGIHANKDFSERLRIGKDCDEVYPGIIMGSGQTVKDIRYLNKIGVTHVLNCAETDVNLSAARYSKEGIIYRGFRCPDLPQSNIEQHFDECANFIELALSFSHGLVFVNCLLGYSRAAVIVAAYLMLKQKMSATQALTLMRQTREVHPNMGFLEQLGRLDDRLRKERYRRL